MFLVAEASVLVTVYFVLLKILRPYLLEDPASNADNLSQFPAADIFLQVQTVRRLHACSA